MGHSTARQGVALAILYASGRVILRLKNDAARVTTLSTEGVEYKADAGASGAKVFAIIDGQSVADKVRQLASNPAVDAVEPDYRVTVGAVPNDALLSQQWHLPAVSAYSAWNLSTGSRSVKVCHVDSGVRVDHPDLAPNVVKGWNLVTAADGTQPAPGTAQYYNYNDTQGHGTHTAGIIAAVGNNALGVAGLAWGAALHVCRFIGDDGGGYVSGAMRCLALCAEEGALITSNSWGGLSAYSGFLESEIKAAQDRGQLFVVAAGNTGTNLDGTAAYPPSYRLPNMISVASTGAADKLSGFSNYGSRDVDVAAPGEGVVSTLRSLGYGPMWGTSMAAPVVAGVAALLSAQAAAAGRNLGYAELKELITQNGDSLPQLAGKIRTGSRVNAAKAMQALAQRLPTPSPSPLPSPPPLLALRPDGPALQRLASSLACGTSALRGARAWQSSTASGRGACGLGSAVPGAYAAVAAVDGRCLGYWKLPVKGSCAVTAKQDSPWWQAQLRAAAIVRAVRLTPRSDCEWAQLAGARVLLGQRPYAGPAGAVKLAEFLECGTVPSNVTSGERLTVSCRAAAAAAKARYLLVLLPQRTARLALCEVDIVTQAWLDSKARAATAEQRPS
eukprot:scaffold8.g1419.t1